MEQPGDVRKRAEPSPSGADSVSVTVRFAGSAAFYPVGASSLPMTAGTAAEVVALFPRAYDADEIDGAVTTDKYEFRPRNGPHVAHHLCVKIDGKYLPGGLSRLVVIPLLDPGADDETYEIDLPGIPAGTGKATYQGFESVAPVLGLHDAKLHRLPADPSVISSNAALARMKLGSGWKLQARDVRQGSMLFMKCTGPTCDPDDKPVTCDNQSKYALVVEAVSPAATGPVSLRVGRNSHEVLNLPLQDENGQIELTILHAPYSEMLGGGDPHAREMHHFKLFYLLVPPEYRRHPFCFPAVEHFLDGDPFCTPLAQVLPRPMPCP